MSRFFGGNGFSVDPAVLSTVEHDYWEEFTRVNETFSHEPDLVIRKIKRNSNNNSKSISNNKIYPGVDSNGVINPSFDDNYAQEDGSGGYVEFRSIGVQTDGNYDDEPEVQFQIYTHCI